MDVMTEEEVRLPLIPLVAAYEFDPFTEPPRRRKQQTECEIGCRLREYPRGMPNRDRSLRAGCYIDVVNSDRHSRHRPELGCGIEEFSIDPIGQHAIEAANLGYP
jgi:hypothetical protein